MTDITDPETLKSLRDEGIAIDAEGYFSFAFGEHKEYELCVEPYQEDGQYFISIYKNRIPLNHKLPIWIKSES